MSRARQREVLEEFVEAAIDYDHAIYLSPWRDRYGEELGPWRGPRTESAFMALVREYAESIHGGGCWDESEDMGAHAERMRQRHARRVMERYDLDDMRAFVERHHHTLGETEIGAWVYYWLEGMSRSQAAKQIGVTEVAIDHAIKRLRTRLRARQHEVSARASTNVDPSQTTRPPGRGL